MEMDTKLKLAVALAGVTLAAAAAGFAHEIRKRRPVKPLPGTTKVAKLYVITEVKTKKK